jgi:caffeoyl-CoA O-methyltransferase
MNVKKCLEIGVFTGYSGLCMASGMGEDGVLHVCDISEEYVAIAQRFWKQGGVDHKI